MAKIFGVDQTQGNTSRIVGTYGYMSPEYAMHGEFSVKSDVYSFGVLVLEIISGKKNSNFFESEGAEDLLSYAWMNWRDGRPLELLDPILGDSFLRDEVMRCIHIGLLGVQEDPAERPTMVTIVLTLNSSSITLPSPQQPAFFVKKDTKKPRAWSLINLQASQCHGLLMKRPLLNCTLNNYIPYLSLCLPTVKASCTLLNDILIRFLLLIIISEEQL